jgi:hypothetical protein
MTLCVKHIPADAAPPNSNVLVQPIEYKRHSRKQSILFNHRLTRIFTDFFQPRILPFPLAYSYRCGRGRLPRLPVSSHLFVGAVRPEPQTRNQKHIYLTTEGTARQSRNQKDFLTTDSHGFTRIFGPRIIRPWRDLARLAESLARLAKRLTRIIRLQRDLAERLTRIKSYINVIPAKASLDG